MKRRSPPTIRRSPSRRPMPKLFASAAAHCWRCDVPRKRWLPSMAPLRSTRTSLLQSFIGVTPSFALKRSTRRWPPSSGRWPSRRITSKPLCAAALRELRRHDDAVASYDGALAIVPDDADALFNRGKSLWTLGRLEEAIEDYKRASALDDPRALGELAFCRLAIADWAEADKLASTLHRSIDDGHFLHSFSTFVFGFGPLDQLKAARNLIRDVVAAAPKPYIH